MSSRKSDKNKPRQLPPHALKYCPQYLEFDAEARKETKTRFREHVTNRKRSLIECVDPAINDITSPLLALQFSNCPRYVDDEQIINTAFSTIDNKINEWNGVQFSKNFITQYNQTGKKMNRKKFDQIAKNHQDQTSWKVSGNKFFAPYIAQAKQYLYEYCQCIIDIPAELRREIYKFACISYAVSLLKGTIKFHRTKAKPLIRHKTLVKSQGIHIELERLYSKLQVTSFIKNAKKLRKAEDGKTTVKSQQFHEKLLNCCNTLYREQKKKVYTLCGACVENICDADDDLKQPTPDVYPQDLMDADGDNNNSNDDDAYKPYKPYKPHKSSSTDESNGNVNVRVFQSINSEYGVRDEMESDIINERRHRRRNNINNINNINNLHTNGVVLRNESVTNINNQSSFDNAVHHNNNNIMRQQLQDENYRLRMERDCILQEIRNIDRINTCAYRYTYPYPYPYPYAYIHNIPPQIQIGIEPQMIVRQHSYPMINSNSPITFIQDIDSMDIPSLPQ